MMKTFTQNLLTCVALLTLFSGSLVAQTFMVVNSPGDIAGDVEVRRAEFGDQDENATTTGDLILGDDGDTTDANGDGVDGTTTDGCQAIVNDVTGQIVILDRGDCNFTVKGNTAQASGAIALLVCNNADTDPIVMTGEAPDVTIPCFMASQADCEVIKMSINNGNTVNVTFEVREEECPVTYDSEVFWGDQPGQGDFSVPFTNDATGWSTLNLEPLDRDDVIWQKTEEGAQIFPSFCGGSYVTESPSFCNGQATFSAVQFAVADDQLVQPYNRYSAELISPIIDCSNADNVILEFYQVYFNLSDDLSTVSVSNDGGANWEEVGSILTDNPQCSAASSSDPITERVRYPLNLCNNSANCRFKITASQLFYFFSVDDVTLRSEVINDIQAEGDFYATAPTSLAPYDFREEIPFLIDLVNKGNSDLDVSVTAEVLKDGNVVYSQTLDYGTIAAGSNADNQVFPETYTPDAGPGEYTIRYTANSANGDDDMSNNIRETTFVLTDVSNETEDIVMSRLPLDYPSIGGWAYNSWGQYNSFGNYYKFNQNTFEDGAMVAITSLDAGVTQLPDDVEMVGFVTAEVYKWIEFEPADGIVQPGERVLIGEGRLTNVTEEGLSNIVLSDPDDSSADILLEINDGEGILVMLHTNSLTGNTTWYAQAISSNGESVNHVATSLAFDSLGIDNYGSFFGSGSTYADYVDRDFGDGGGLTFHTPIYLKKIPTGVNELNKTIQFEVYPNPTSGNVNIDFKLEETADYALIKIMDATGKFVKGMKYTNISERNVSIDMSQFNAGLYNLIIQTPNGFNSKQFTVIK